MFGGKGRHMGKIRPPTSRCLCSSASLASSSARRRSASSSSLDFFPFFPFGDFGLGAIPHRAFPAARKGEKSLFLSAHRAACA